MSSKHDHAMGACCGCCSDEEIGSASYSSSESEVERPSASYRVPRNGRSVRHVCELDANDPLRGNPVWRKVMDVNR